MENKVEEKITKKSKKFKIILAIIILIISWAWFTKAWFIPNFTDSELLCPWEEEKKNYNQNSWGVDLKPVIYLYPQKETNINVKLDYKWEIFADYPKYDKSIKWWNITAYPNWTVIDNRDNKEYSYLFWEWIPEKNINWNLSRGFIVEWKDSREFLQKTLSEMWMVPREYNEFIVFWYPKMMSNKYNLIHFAWKKYTENASLEITPKPDSILRVFMLMKPLKEKIKIKPQVLEKFKRKGFAVIEWGWSELK